jgi:hypothetical protein
MQLKGEKEEGNENKKKEPNLQLSAIISTDGVPPI